MENRARLGRTELFVSRMELEQWSGAAEGVRALDARAACLRPLRQPGRGRARRGGEPGGRVNLIDTAEFYSLGASERRVGELTRRARCIGRTKFPPSLFARLDRFQSALADSMTRLGRDPIDLFQHHYPSDRISIPELMALMAAAVQDGKVKAVGVSNYSAAQMRLAHAELAKHGIPLRRIRCSTLSLIANLRWMGSSTLARSWASRFSRTRLLRWVP